MRFKQFFLLIALSLLFLNVNSQTCTPGTKDIYGFETGSLFQYKKTSTSFTGGNPVTYTEIEKYSVSDKREQNDSIIIIRNGIRLSYTSYEINYEPVVKTTREFIDTVIVIDSLSHFLNACDSQLVCLELENNIYSYLKISDTGDGAEKRIGGTDNLYKYNSEDSLIVFDDFEYEQVYLEGIGLVSEYEFIFEYSGNIILEGYVINGDTTGLIWDDTDFYTSVSEKEIDDLFVIYPTIITDFELITIPDIDNLQSIIITDLNGVSQEYEREGESSIKLLHATSGIYLITIVIEDKPYNFKIIKI